MVEKPIIDNGRNYSVRAVAAVGSYIAEHAGDIVGEPFEFLEEDGLEMSIEFINSKRAVIHVTKKEAQIVTF